MSRILLVLLLALPAAVEAVTPSLALRQQVVDAATETQTRCYRLIHHDTFAYEACVLGLLQDENKPTPRRLGIEYFGYVGALNSARLGMLGAESCAWEMLQRVRVTQKRLHVDDPALCAAIPGDCAVRIARTRLMAAAPRPASVEREESGHVH